MTWQEDAAVEIINRMPRVFLRALDQGYPCVYGSRFIDTELRYLLRHYRYAEIPIRYRAPSPNVSRKAMVNSLCVLLHYFHLRLRGKAALVT